MPSSFPSLVEIYNWRRSRSKPATPTAEHHGISKKLKLRRSKADGYETTFTPPLFKLGCTSPSNEVLHRHLLEGTVTGLKICWQLQICSGISGHTKNNYTGHIYSLRKIFRCIKICLGISKYIYGLFPHMDRHTTNDKIILTPTHTSTMTHLSTTSNIFAKLGPMRLKV